jgi:hypothetical protein
MTLNEKSKAKLLNNKSLIKYCKTNQLDITKLSQCRIEHMQDKYVFGLRKENQPEPEGLLGNDIATQPDIVLIMEPDRVKGWSFETTDKTGRIKEC